MKIGRMTATGGSIRWAISQKAISSFANAALKRLPIVAMATRKRTPAISTAAHQYTPANTTRVTANEPQRMKTATIPILGRYLKRSSAYAANEPMKRARSELTSPTTTVFR